MSQDLFSENTPYGLILTSVTSWKGDVTREDSQQWFFCATQRCNIVVTLFQVVTTLFQHCNNVLCLKSLLRIIPCNITLNDHHFFVEVMAVFFLLWLLLCFLFNLGASQRTKDHLHLSFQLIQMNQHTVFVIRYAAVNVKVSSVSPKSNQHQFSPNNINAQSRGKIVRINWSITN